MKNFYTGFVLGVFLKNHVIKLSTDIIKTGINIFYLMHKKENVKINELINELTIVVKVKNTVNEKYEKYLSNEKSLIKINMGKDIVQFLNTNDFELNIESLCDLCNFSFTEFEKIGNVYLYIGYTLNDEKYINVYSPVDIINNNNFIIQNCNFKSLFLNTICASVNYGNNKNEYITKYFKQFFNNNLQITSEMIMMNYNKININLLNCKIIIVKPPNLIETYSINQIIN